MTRTLLLAAALASAQHPTTDEIPGLVDAVYVVTTVDGDVDREAIQARAELVAVRNGIRLADHYASATDTLAIHVMESPVRVGLEKLGSAIAYTISLRQAATLDRPSRPSVAPVTWQRSGLLVSRQGATGAVLDAIEQDLEQFAALRRAARQARSTAATDGARGRARAAAGHVP